MLGGARVAVVVRVSAVHYNSLAEIDRLRTENQRLRSAFGGGDTLVNPGDLDVALKSYEAAAALAKGSEDADILLGRVHEGMAAVGKYKRDTDLLCTNAFTSIDHYKAAGAAELSDIPNKIATDGRCKPK